MTSTTKEASMNFDKVLDHIGNLGRYQLIHICVLYISIVPSGMYSLANVFFAAVPDYWCATGLSNATNSKNFSVDSMKEDSCGYSSNGHNSEYTSNYTGSIEETCQEWDYDSSVYGSTIVTEWGFVCSKEWLASLSQTTYMCGIFIGAFVAGAIGDKFGRKKGWIIGLALMSISGTVASFTPNYWAFITFRLVSAIGNACSFVSAFVLMMEITASKYRVKIGVYCQLPFAVGYMMLAWIAYFLTEMRHLALFIGLFPIIMLPLYCLVEESPRWLMAKDRFEKASAIVRKMCAKNKVEYPQSLMEKETEQIEKSRKDTSKKSQKSSGVLDLVRTPKIRIRSFAIAYGWILCSLTYYGLSQASSDLVGGPHLNLFLSGLMEFPGILLCGWLLDKIGRKWTLAGVFFLAGLCVLLIPAVLQDYPIVTTVLSMTGKMAISGGFSVIYVYTAELFPTVIRTMAVGAGSMSSRIGSITSPNIILLASIWVGFPFIVFGALTLLGGFVTLVLPETLHYPLQETVEEAESFGKGACQNIREFPCRKSQVESGNEENVV